MQTSPKNSDLHSLCRDIRRDYSAGHTIRDAAMVNHALSLLSKSQEILELIAQRDRLLRQVESLKD